MSTMRSWPRPLILLFALATVLFVSSASLAASAARANGGSFIDNLAAFDPIRWHMANWGNPLPPFSNYWRPDHIQFVDGIMRIRLDNTPCPGGCGGRSYASGEYRSNDFYRYGRFETRLKASNAPGTVTTFFVYTRD